MRWFQLFEDMADSLRGIERAVESIARTLDEPPAEPSGFHFTVGPTVPKNGGAAMALTVTSTTAEKVKVKAVPNGTLDGPVTATVTSGTGTVEPVDDTSFFVVSPDAQDGGTNYLVSAPVGGSMVEDTVTYTYTEAAPPPATSLGLTSEPPVPKVEGATPR